MRQGRPLIILSIDCRRAFHATCPHQLEQSTAHCTYLVHCACDCHRRNENDPPELQRLRLDLAARGDIRGNFDSSLSPMPPDVHRATTPRRSADLNPLTELDQLAPKDPKNQQQVLLDPRPATSVARPTIAEMLPSTPMEQKPRISKALACDQCGEKRQVVEWMTSNPWGKPRSR